MGLKWIKTKQITAQKLILEEEKLTQTTHLKLLVTYCLMK